ncbi:MAG TPA: DNA polymerase III subunit beta, partial [Planctomycetota bacterium]|nr:DNA polymerase III subunit beta [Planctomycetota bacterium]
MKVICGRDRLREALSVVAGALPAKTPKPILDAVKLEARKGTLSLLATDLEVAIRYEIPDVEVASSGTCVVPAREALEFVRDLGDDTVQVELARNVVRILGKEDTCELAVADAGEFPEMPAVEETCSFTAPAPELALQLERTAFAAAKEIGRFAMNGVRVEVQKDRLRAIATDGRRLSLVEQAIELETAAREGETSAATLPTRAVQQVVRVLQGEAEPVKVALASDRAAFRTEHATVVTRLLEGEFPRYQAVIPKESKNVAECDSRLLAAKIRLVAHLCAPEQPIVRFQFTSSSLSLSASSPQRGEARAEM